MLPTTNPALSLPIDTVIESLVVVMRGDIMVGIQYSLPARTCVNWVLSEEIYPSLHLHVTLAVSHGTEPASYSGLAFSSVHVYSNYDKS
jgi:hypothetical protein